MKRPSKNCALWNYYFKHIRIYQTNKQIRKQLDKQSEIYQVCKLMKLFKTPECSQQLHKSYQEPTYWKKTNSFKADLTLKSSKAVSRPKPVWKNKYSDLIQQQFKLYFDQKAALKLKLTGKESDLDIHKLLFDSKDLWISTQNYGHFPSGNRDRTLEHLAQSRGRRKCAVIKKKKEQMKEKIQKQIQSKLEQERNRFEQNLLKAQKFENQFLKAENQSIKIFIDHINDQYIFSHSSPPYQPSWEFQSKRKYQSKTKLVEVSLPDYSQQVRQIPKKQFTKQEQFQLANKRSPQFIREQNVSKLGYDHPGGRAIINRIQLFGLKKC